MVVQSISGLLDGLFSNQKSKFGYNLVGLGMEKVGIFYDHLEYFTAIWHISWPFGIVCGHLVYFSRFGMLRPRKIWQPWSICAKMKLLFGEMRNKTRK
jgi:hypothetical protein